MEQDGQVEKKKPHIMLSTNKNNIILLMSSYSKGYPVIHVLARLAYTSPDEKREEAVESSPPCETALASFVVRANRIICRMPRIG
jgi:hypothetical protein